ncbi:GerAB/ArcD/ProY family transporter [Oceanobacillus alkalisoli]|uniref:GerAB/ArcD/ProY family transporter n=1 Tax=Oceanobacillus alkalisoli TaxID=2925113 RepID=UPI001F12026A|nr:GerAB/ArcD/ProY family transporter [Oceanobacillus alkalisoli]MCF3942312.1 spore germination protein [Oceanobacillus alkalisoli]
MKVNLQIPKGEQFRSFYMFFIIASMQLGVGLIGIPRILYLKAGHDAWISILLAYLYIALLLFVMLYILRQYENTDILGVQTDLFGSFISKVLGTVYIVYFIFYILSTLVTYIQIIKVFVLPNSNVLVLGGMLLIIAVYTVFGGLKAVIGITFLFFIVSTWLFLLLIEPVQQMDFLNFLPVMDRGVTDILRGTVATSYTFTGFEILFFIYPFVANKEKIGKPVFLGISYFTCVVLLATNIAIGFLSPAQLERRIWPVLNLFKIQTSPIIERLDYVAIAEWMMVAMPKVIILMWCITYIAKRIYNLPSKISVYASASIILILIPFFNEHFKIQHLIDNVSMVSYGIVYIYPFLLLPLVILKKKIRKNKEGK